MGKLEGSGYLPPILDLSFCTLTTDSRHIRGHTGADGLSEVVLEGLEDP